MECNTMPCRAAPRAPAPLVYMLATARTARAQCHRCCFQRLGSLWRAVTCPACVPRRTTEPKETIDLFGRRAGPPEPAVERSFPSAFQVAHERRRTYVLRPCPIDNETDDMDMLADESTRWTHTINAAVDSIGRLFIERFRRAA